MAKYTMPEVAVYDNEMDMFETTTPVHADVMNAKFGQVLENEQAIMDSVLENSSKLQNIETDLSTKITKSNGTGTIPTTGWIANAGDYAYKLNLDIVGILATDAIDVYINNDDLDVAQGCELSPNNDSYDGGVTFYSKITPTATIGFNYRGLR